MIPRALYMYIEIGEVNAWQMLEAKFPLLEWKITNK